MTRISGLACFLLVTLRLVIGWHFLVEGVHKIRTHQIGKTATNTPWSGEGFFREGIGPVAETYRTALGISDIDAVARFGPDGPQKLAADWDNRFSAIASHYRLTDEQISAAKARYEQLRKSTDDWLLGRTPTDVKKPVTWGTADIHQTVTERMAEYNAKKHEVDEAIKSKLPAFNQDVEKTRLRTLKADAARILADLQTDLAARTADMQKQVIEAAKLTDEQKQAGPPAEPMPASRPIDSLDHVTMWLHAVLGAFLLLGLFSRLSCLLLAGFLIQVVLIAPALPYAPTPPGAPGHYLYVNLYVIEAVALLALAAMPTGRWFGLDALLSCRRAQRGAIHGH